MRHSKLPHSKLPAKLLPAARSYPGPAADAVQHLPAELLPVELQKAVPELASVELAQARRSTALALALAQHPDAPESAVDALA